MRDDHGQDAEDAEQHLEVEGELVAGREAEVRGVPAALRPLEAGEGEGDQQAGDRDHGHRVAPAAGGEDQVHDHRHEQGRRDGGDRRDLREVAARLFERVIDGRADG